MYIRILDGIVSFAEYFISTTLTEQQRNIFRSFQVETDGIVCYSEEEKLQVENLLINNNITFLTEQIIFTEEQKQKVNNKKFNSRTEAIEFLNGVIEEPESEIITNLKKEKEDLKLKLDQAENALLTIMFSSKI